MKQITTLILLFAFLIVSSQIFIAAENFSVIDENGKPLSAGSNVCQYSKVNIAPSYGNSDSVKITVSDGVSDIEEFTTSDTNFYFQVKGAVGYTADFKTTFPNNTELSASFKISDCGYPATNLPTANPFLIDVPTNALTLSADAFNVESIKVEYRELYENF